MTWVGAGYDDEGSEGRMQAALWMRRDAGEWYARERHIRGGVGICRAGREAAQTAA